MSEENPIRVLIAREGEHWVAQCLEYDIGAQAKDLKELHKRVLAAVNAERQESIRRHGAAFAGIERAPDHFHRLSRSVEP